ncbi:MAG: hypothetical protein ACYC9Q_09340 [Bacillota bacterium]
MDESVRLHADLRRGLRDLLMQSEEFLHRSRSRCSWGRLTAEGFRLQDKLRPEWKEFKAILKECSASSANGEINKARVFLDMIRNQAGRGSATDYRRDVIIEKGEQALDALVRFAEKGALAVEEENLGTGYDQGV